MNKVNIRKASLGFSALVLTLSATVVPMSGVWAAGDASGDVVSEVTDATKATVKTYEEFKKALADTNIATIELAEDIEATEVIAINRALTIVGDNHKITSTADHGFDIVTTEAVVLDGVKLVAKKSGSWGVVIEKDGTPVDNYDVTIRNSSIQSNARAIRAGSGKLRVIASELKWVNTNGENVANPVTTQSDGYSWGFSNPKPAGMDWEIDGVTISGYRYDATFNDVDATGAKLVIRNSNFTGRSNIAILSFATEDAPFNVTVENSTFHGINNYGGSEESYANIVIEKNTTKYINMTIDNVGFTVYENETGLNNGAAQQYAVTNRTAGDGNTNKVSIYGNTTYLVSKDYKEAKTLQTRNFQENDEAVYNFDTPEKTGITVYGGTYSYDPTSFLAEGKAAYALDDGTFYVTDATKIEAPDEVYVLVGKSLDVSGYAITPEKIGEITHTITWETNAPEEEVTVSGTTFTPLKAGAYTISGVDHWKNEKSITLYAYTIDVEDDASEAIDAETDVDVSDVEKANKEALNTQVSAVVEAALSAGATATDQIVDGEIDGVKFNVNAYGMMQAVQNGYTIEATLEEPYELDAYDIADLADQGVVDAIEVKLGDKELVGYYDIKVNLKGVRAGTADLELGSISELNEALTLTLDLSGADLPEAADGMERTFQVVRHHLAGYDANGDPIYEVEVLDAEYDEATGLLTFTSDKFSTYAVAYVDSATATTPDTGVFTGTGANAATISAAVLATLVGLAVSAFSFKKLVLKK